MALEPPNEGHESATSPTKVLYGTQAPLEVTDDKNKTPRHPRWTRQETMVLIQGKKIAENRGQKGRRSSSVLGVDKFEPKWDTVSSYCKQHGVNRGPVQCRKRWSNLIGDFKKIKTWESQVKEEAESFWEMRNDLKREKKLPGFFDREVYNVLDGKAYTAAAFQLALVTVSADRNDCDGMEAVMGEEDEEEEAEEEPETVFDSGRHATAEDGLFSEFEPLTQEEIGRSPEKERVTTNSPTKTIPAPVPISGTTSQEGWKRRRRTSPNECQDNNLENHLIKVLENNGNMLSAQLEAQNINCKLDRDQLKKNNDNLLAALTKVTDALVRIAEKL
ncbi:unnamed protein product [Ilex paraguariensis]|uniref:Myb-like domain-containing protein n=1 Tax=Ilex paraguariensis TaxID=185542 RepID=A0ABC8U6V4_9AQUA